MKAYISNVANRYYRLHQLTDDFTKTIQENASFLEPGQFVIHSSLRAAYLDTPIVSNYFFDLFLPANDRLIVPKTPKNFIKKMLRKKKIVINSDSNIFNGQLLFLTNNRITQMRDVKIFDVVSEEVLTYYCEGNSLKREIAIYEHFKPYFNIPRFIRCEADENFLVEQLVEAIPPRKWSYRAYLDVLQYYFVSYQNYLNSLSNVSYPGDEYLSSLDYLVKDEILGDLTFELLRNIPKNILNDQIPLVKQHGDFYSSNVLVDVNNKIFVIDWTYADEYFFFNDILNFIRVEACCSRQVAIYKNC